MPVSAVAEHEPGHNALILAEQVEELTLTLTLTLTPLPTPHSRSPQPQPDPHQVEESNARKTGSAHGRSMWTAEEDGLVEEGVRRGCKWQQIATALPARSDSYATERSNP